MYDSVRAIELYNQGLDIDEIAVALNLDVGVVEDLLIEDTENG